MGHAFWKENIADSVKLLRSNVWNCCLKITTTDLRIIGLRMREWCFRELSSSISPRGRGLVPHATTPSSPPPPPEIFFALLAMNGPLPTKLKFRENTDCTHMIRQSLNKWPLMWDSGHGCLSTRAMYSSDICQTGGCFPLKRAGLLKFPSARNKKKTGKFPEVKNYPESYANYN